MWCFLNSKRRVNKLDKPYEEMTEKEKKEYWRSRGVCHMCRYYSRAQCEKLKKFVYFDDACEYFRYPE